LSDSACCSASVTILITKTRRRSNGHRLILVCCLVLTRDIHNTIYNQHIRTYIFLLQQSRLTSINIKCDFNLWYGAGGMPTRLKLPRSLLSRTSSRSPWKIFTSCTLTVSCHREDLRFLGGDSCVTVDEFSHDTTQSLNTCKKKTVNFPIAEKNSTLQTEGKGRNIQKQKVCNLPS
jgi:hypothetical protein